MGIKRICVVTSDVPFVRGGHRIIAETLVRMLEKYGYSASLLLTPQNRFGRQFSAYLANWLTDVGMTGPHDSVIGIRKEDALARFLTQIPHRFRLGIEDVKFCGAMVEIDSDSGKARSIERLKVDVPKEEN